MWRHLPWLRWKDFMHLCASKFHLNRRSFYVDRSVQSEIHHRLSSLFLLFFFSSLFFVGQCAFVTKRDESSYLIIRKISLAICGNKYVSIHQGIYYKNKFNTTISLVVHECSTSIKSSKNVKIWLKSMRDDAGNRKLFDCANHWNHRAINGVESGPRGRNEETTER